MSFPRISAALNNCPLHVLTPELRGEIRLFAFADRHTDLHQDIINSYGEFKTAFATFYQYDNPTGFSWQDFAKLLDKINPFDLQIILGPALRAFMAQRMQADPDKVMLAQAAHDDAYMDGSLEDFIRYKTEIQSDGRYAALSPDEMFSFVAEPLGLMVTYTKDGVPRTLPDDPAKQREFAERPHIELFHEGGIEGAGMGGHFERTESEEGRIDYEQDQTADLRVVAALFKYGDLEISTIGVTLLGSYLEIHEETDPNEIDRRRKTFHLTVAQIEKFLFNKLYVPHDYAKSLLGPITSKANDLIARITNIDGTMAYDDEILTLLRSYLDRERDRDRAEPVKQQVLSQQQYELALVLLTPPVAQNQAHDYDYSPSRSPDLSQSSEGLWALRANEISALQSLANDYAQNILFDQGLSASLYALCNRREIAENLSGDFLELLANDADFGNKASECLKAKVSTRVVSQSTEIINVPDINAEPDSDGTRSSKPEQGEIRSSPVAMGPYSPPPNPVFWLRAIQFWLAVGGVCAVVAVLSCPPVATTLGLSTVYGVTVSEIAVTATFLAGTSALIAASLFAVKKMVEDPVVEPSNLPNII